MVEYPHYHTGLAYGHSATSSRLTTYVVGPSQNMVSIPPESAEGDTNPRRYRLRGDSAQVQRPTVPTVNESTVEEEEKEGASSGLPSPEQLVGTDEGEDMQAALLAQYNGTVMQAQISALAEEVTQPHRPTSNLQDQQYLIRAESA